MYCIALKWGMFGSESIRQIHKLLKGMSQINKTTVRTYFSLYGDYFSVHDVTENLNIIPTITYNKGDVIPNRSTVRYRKNTSWEIDTGNQESFDVNEQLQQIILQLKDKITNINELKSRYNMECIFVIVIIIEQGYTPGLVLEKEVIQFASAIGAEFSIDLYANPYENDL